MNLSLIIKMKKLINKNCRIECLEMKCIFINKYRINYKVDIL